MNAIWYGGDYNPEQWPRDVWDEDVRLMNEAHVSLATVGVFSWAQLEPREGEFDFDWLDDVLARLHAGGVRVDLATATASPPPWLTLSHPEVLPVTVDGVRLSTGSRQHYCPSSLVYRRRAGRLVDALVTRYASHPAVEMWHINNEYGCHVSRCYCDVSADAFRAWLEAKYGTVEALNAAWGTAFWSQRYSAFDEVFAPRLAPTFQNPAQLVDFDRFSSDELLACYQMEKRIIRASTAAPITTNFMGFFKGVDYWRWAREVDIVSDDSYPDPSDPTSPMTAAMSRDLMRSLACGKPWMLMEQAPSAVNWRPRNTPTRPGQYRAWSLQAVARGATGILQFQWRQSVQGAEKFHSGMLPHGGTDTRVWREVSALGAELAALEVAGTVEARVAVVFDWDSWWAIEQSALPAEQSYLANVTAWYETLWRHNVAVDFVPTGADLSGYAATVVPTLFSASAATLASLDGYVRSGGSLLVTYQSGIVDEHGRITEGGYLGALARTLGIRVEEFAPREDTWAEYIHAVDADVIDTFGSSSSTRGDTAWEDLAGWPAITRNSVGAGRAWYAATLPDAQRREDLLRRVLDEAGLDLGSRDSLSGVERVRRGNTEFVIDHALARVEMFAATPTVRDGPRTVRSGARAADAERENDVQAADGAPHST